MNMNRILLVSFIIFSIMLSSCLGSATAQSDQDTKSILSVNGTGRAFLTPDIAYINIGVHTEGSDAAEAVDSNNTVSQLVKESLSKYKINPNDIQTTNFSIWPNQQYDSEGVITGIIYSVDNNIRVLLRSPDKIGEVLNTVIDAGANRIDSIQFDVEDRSAALSEARIAAIANADSQAQELAEAAGLKVGPTISISSTGGVIPYPIYEGKGGGGMGAAEASVPVSPGQMIVTVDVQMVYELIH